MTHTLLKIIFVVLLLPISTHAIGQSAADRMLDSLRTALSSSEGRSAAELSHELSGVYARIETDSALHYAGVERTYAQQLNDSTLYAQSINDEGVANLFGGNFDEAVGNFNHASAIHTRLGNHVFAAKSLNNLGAIHEHRGELESAMAAFIGALGAFEAGGETEYAAQAKNNVATIHNRLRNFERALRMFRELEAYRLADGSDPVELAYVRGNMANAFNSLNKADSAIHYYQAAITALEASGTDQLRLPQFYINLGQVYRELGRSKEALQYYQRGKALAEQAGSAKDYASALLGIGIASVRTGAYSQAVAALQESLPYLKSAQLNEQVHGAHYELIAAFAGANMPDSAVHYAKLYREASDARQSEQAALAIAELETKYFTEQKERALVEERAARLDEQLASRTRTLWLLGGLGFAIFVGSIGYLLYRQQRIRNSQLAQESQLKLALARIEAQNELQEQRLRISRDLHDNIGAQLSFIISTVDNVRLRSSKQSGDVVGKLDQLSTFASGTVRELRDTVWAMNKDGVSIQDLRDRIANLLSERGLQGNPSSLILLKRLSNSKI